ncbi:MAG: hypothetical protein R3Y09_03610 [Clostridia bacterium]
MLILKFCMIISLILASIEDVKDNMVSDLYTFGFAYLCIVYNIIYRQQLVLVLMATILLITIYKSGRQMYFGMGTADIVIYLGFLLKFNFVSFLLAVLISNLTGIICYCLTRKQQEKGIAMMPFFLLALLLV